MKTQVLVIGGGPGGYVAAIRLAQLGKQVVLAEKRGQLGGCCLNEGCIPSKAILESSKHFALLQGKAQEHGVMVAEATLDFGQLMARKDKVIQTNQKGLDYLMKKNQIEVLPALARLTGSHSALVGEQAIEFEHCILATGSEPIPLPGFPVDQQQIMDSTGFLAQTSLPQSLIVLGAGVIGLEMACAFAQLGVEVTVVELGETLLPGAEEDSQKELLRCLKKKKIKFLFQTRALSAQATGAEVTLALQTPKGEQTLLAERLLVAVGRRPFAAGLGLEAAGVKQDAKGFVLVNQQGQTNLPHVYALGDLIGGAMLAHKASEEAVQVAEVLAGKRAALHLPPVPQVVYTAPEVASIGPSSQHLQAQGVEFIAGSFPLRPLGRALASGELDGFAKVLAAPDGRLLAAHLVGERVTDWISEAALALTKGLSLQDIEETIHPHPSFAEAFKEAASTALGLGHHL